MWSRLVKSIWQSLPAFAVMVYVFMLSLPALNEPEGLFARRLGPPSHWLPLLGGCLVGAWLGHVVPRALERRRLHRRAARPGQKVGF